MKGEIADPQFLITGRITDKGEIRPSRAMKNGKAWDIPQRG